MADNYLLPENDNLVARESGALAKDKLFFLQKYMSAFETSMRAKPWRRRIYIDLFSGPGKCRTRESNEYFLGSPLLSLTTSHPFTDYYFVDTEPDNIAALRARSAATRVEQSRIHCLVGDANKKISEITDEIKRIDSQYIAGAWPSLNLAFLDPEGFDLEWNTVAELATVKKMDLIIHYSQQGIKRMADRALVSEKPTAIDRFFGDLEWRRVYESCRDDLTGVHRTLIDYYKSKLKVLGYLEIREDEEIWAEPLMRNRKNSPLYRLLFVSKNPLGVKFWKDVTRVGADGQMLLWK
ncbi:MAG: three-Cys-motif partner protein TcmP [Anaerolineales bacterium]